MKGKLIVLEGLDGSGKATQAGLLTERLASQGREVQKISFPDYANKSSTLVKMYLDGEIGSLQEVNPYAASSFYSLDRYISYRTGWSANYLAGGWIVADRYTTSNLTHQMGKLPREQWKDYIEWLTHYEYGLLGLPAPDLVLYLDMHPKASEQLIEKRFDAGGHPKDLHEQNLAYLSSCRESAFYAAQILGWTVIPCSDEQHRPIMVDPIAESVWETVQKWSDSEDLC